MRARIRRHRVRRACRSWAVALADSSYGRSLVEGPSERGDASVGIPGLILVVLVDPGSSHRLGGRPGQRGGTGGCGVRGARILEDVERQADAEVALIVRTHGFLPDVVHVRGVRQALTAC